MVPRCFGLIFIAPFLTSLTVLAWLDYSSDATWLLSKAHAAPKNATLVKIQPCIQQLNTRSTPIKGIFARGTYREGEKTYYLLHLFPPRMEIGVRDAVISLGVSGCQIHALYPSGNSIPVSASIPLSVARGLNLSILKADIASSGGLQKYQSRLNLAAKDSGRLYLDPNKVWALKQLGIRISPSTQILSPSSQ